MWMKNRLTVKQIEQVGSVLDKLRQSAASDAEVARQLGVNQAHISHHKRGVITPTLFSALVDKGLVIPLRQRVRLSADMDSVEQRDACHNMSAKLGHSSWSAYVRHLATAGQLQSEVLHVLQLYLNGNASLEHFLSIARLWKSLEDEKR